MPSPLVVAAVLPLLAAACLGWWRAALWRREADRWREIAGGWRKASDDWRERYGRAVVAACERCEVMP